MTHNNHHITQCIHHYQYVLVREDKRIWSVFSEQFPFCIQGIPEKRFFLTIIASRGVCREQNTDWRMTVWNSVVMFILYSATTQHPSTKNSLPTNCIILTSILDIDNITCSERCNQERHVNSCTIFLFTAFAVQSKMIQSSTLAHSPFVI